MGSSGITLEWQIVALGFPGHGGALARRSRRMLENCAFPVYVHRDEVFLAHSRRLFSQLGAGRSCHRGKQLCNYALGFPRNLALTQHSDQFPRTVRDTRETDKFEDSLKDFAREGFR